MVSIGPDVSDVIVFRTTSERVALKYASIQLVSRCVKLVVAGTRTNVPNLVPFFSLRLLRGGIKFGTDSQREAYYDSTKFTDQV